MAISERFSLNLSGYAHRNLHFQRGAVAINRDGTVRRIPRHAYPLQSFRYLGHDADLPITRRRGDDAAQGLVEPAADSIVAIVQVTASAVPLFPDAGSTLLQHIQITGIARLFEQLVKPVTLLRQGGPFREHRNAHQAGGQVAVVQGSRALLQLRHHRRHQGFRYSAHQQREHQVQLAPGAVQARFRVIKHLMDALGQRLITQAELRSSRRVL